MGDVKPFDCLAFDLDDTLLDTSRWLVPQATRDACQAMIDAGLKATLDQCLALRADWALTAPRSDFYEKLVEHFGCRATNQARIVLDAGQKAFYDRDIEIDLELMPGAEKILGELKSRYHLILVTAGTPRTQQLKIEKLKLQRYFHEARIVNSLLGERKLNAFISIAANDRIAPERHLSIGNRVDTDVGEARQAGWRGCWLHHGEYSWLKPNLDYEQPDYEIESLEELITKCRL